ncbi:MAG: hypothetical protein C4326_13240 [Ignavibacteria bacterium]
MKRIPQTTRRVWVLSELYYPEQSATGYYVTGVAEALANDFDVRVLCAQPTYAARGTKAPQREVRRGVTIYRCLATTFNKDRLAFRFVNLLTISLSILLCGLFRIRTGDIVFVVTNPPTLPFVASLICKFRNCALVLRIEDVYPEALVAAGFTRRDSLLVKAINVLHRWLYRKAAAVIVLGHDMKALVERKAVASKGGNSTNKLSVIPNWADVEDIRPLPREGNPLLRRLGLEGKFVLQYSGNMGRTHDIEILVEAATLLRSVEDIHFLFIGSGAKAPSLYRAKASRKLANMTILPPLDRTELLVSLNACDVAVISFVSDMAGVSVPSRMYNVFAAGKPILAISDKESEIGRVIEETQLGWVIAPGDLIGLQKAILHVFENRNLLSAFSDKAHSFVQRDYTYASVTERYKQLIRNVSNNHLVQQE